MEEIIVAIGVDGSDFTICLTCGDIILEPKSETWEKLE